MKLTSGQLELYRDGNYCMYWWAPNRHLFVRCVSCESVDSELHFSYCGISPMRSNKVSLKLNKLHNMINYLGAL